MTHYKILREHEAWKNGIKMAAVLNTRSNKEHVGFVHPNGDVEIMVGTKATLKRIKLS